jgi:hypothetical protein
LVERDLAKVEVAGSKPVSRSSFEPGARSETEEYAGLLNTPESARALRAHLEAALKRLDIDDELDRLVNPRHTDHDRHAYLPRKIADQVEAARREIQKALDALV